MLLGQPQIKCTTGDYSEEYGPIIVYIKVIHNTVADAIAQLDHGPLHVIGILRWPLLSAGVITPRKPRKLVHLWQITMNP